jgi:hypothetical protein
MFIDKVVNIQVVISNNQPVTGASPEISRHRDKPTPQLPPHRRTPSPASTIVAPLPQKGDPSFSTNSLPQLQSLNRELSQSPLDATMDMVTRLRLNVRERELLFASLNSSLSASAGSSPCIEDFPTTATTTTNLTHRQAGTHSDQSNLRTILESFAQLDRMDRRAVLSILSDTMTPDALATPARLSELPPPPYGGYGSAPDRTTGNFDALR